LGQQPLSSFEKTSAGPSRAPVARLCSQTRTSNAPRRGSNGNGAEPEPLPFASRRGAGLTGRACRAAIRAASADCGVFSGDALLLAAPSCRASPVILAELGRWAVPPSRLQAGLLVGVFCCGCGGSHHEFATHNQSLVTRLTLKSCTPRAAAAAFSASTTSGASAPYFSKYLSLEPFSDSVGLCAVQYSKVTQSS